MAEVHLQPVPGTSVVFHQPGAAPAIKGVGQAVAVAKDANGKTISVSGTVAGITHNNPA